MVLSRPLLVSSLVLLLGSEAHAFLSSPLLGHGITRSSTRASVTGAAAARCSANEVTIPAIRNMSGADIGCAVPRDLARLTAETP